MGSKKDTFKKQFQTNKTNTVKRSDKKYNKQTSKSDKEYISGNYVSSVDKKIFGIKNSFAEGKKVNGYGDDYVDTKGMKRSRYLKKQQGENPYDVKYKYTGKKKTVKGGINSKGEKYDSYTTRKEKLTKYEKESFKNTGTLNDKEYMPKQKYAILSSHKWDNAEKFNDHFNTGVADGYETAKANQRKGKHVSNAIEYLKGGVKDILIDPAADFMKGVGAIGSYGLAGVAGIAEDSGNVVKAIADPNRDLKYYTQGRNNTLENLKANKEELDKTGFGKSMGSFLNEAKVRADDAEIRFLNETGRSKDAEEYKKEIEKNKKRDTNLLNATGFAMELLAPSAIEDKVVDVMKGLGKNTAKSFKELKNGTANLAIGIVPEETAKLMANSKKYAGNGSKVTNASDDVFYSGKKGNTSIDRKLDNEFNKTVDRIKYTVKQNPNTKNIGKFLDTLDEKPLKGTQRNIDGRTLNKKYTQTKDGYKPQLIRSVDEVDDVVSGNVKGQYSMFGKDGSMNAYIDNIQNPYARYEKVINKYGDDIDGLIEKIDSMSSHNADATLDYLRKTRPEVYEQVVKGSDEITDMIESTTRRRGYETQQKIKDDNKYFKTQDVNTPKFSTEELAKQKYIKENNYKLLKDVFNPKFVDNVGNIKEREGLFRAGVKNFAQNVSTLSEGALEEASVQIKNAKYLVDKGEIGAYEVSKMLNELFFDGKDVIRRNVTPRHANQLLDYVDDMIVKQANGVLEEFDSLGNKIPVGEDARKISASLTDYRYDEKMSNLASHFGVKNKAELTNRYKELQTKKRVQPLNTDEFYEYKELGDKIAKWDDEYKNVKYMSDEYDDYAKKAYGKKDGTEGYKEALDELADSGKNKRLSYEEFVAQQNTSKTALDKTLDAKEWKKEVNKRWKEYNLDLDGATDERNLELVRGEKMRNQLRENSSSIKNDNVGQNSRARQELASDVGEHLIPKYTTQDLQKMKDIQKRTNTIRKAFNLPETKPMKVKLTNGQKLGDLPPVRENLAHLKKTIQKEIRYMFENPDKYEHFEEGFKQIKQGYVNTLRGYGVPDEKYFHKVVALQNELKGKMNDILKGGEKNTPLLKMELQKLANRVDETFKGFDDVVLDKFNDTKIGEQANIFDIFDDKDLQPNKDYVHLPELLEEQNNFPIDGNFDVFDSLKPNIDKDSQIDMLGYITGQKIDVDKKSLYRSKKKRKFNTVDELDDTSFSLPKISNQLDSGSFKQYADKLYELGINPYQKPPKTKPKNMNEEVYRYWNDFSNKVLSDDVSKKGVDELKKIDEHITKNSKELAKPTKTTPDKSLENLNIYEDSMKNSTKTIHKNIDEYNKLNKHIDDVNIDNYMGAINKMNSEGVPTFEQFKEAVSKNSNGKLPYEDSKIYDVYKRWLNSYKKGLTVYNPGWHIQNFFQNKGQNFLALGADAFVPQTEAKNIIRKMNGRNYKDVNVFDSKNKINYSMDDITKLAQELGVVDGLGEDVRNARGIFSPLETRIDNFGFMKRLGEVEETARMHHFVKQLEKGMSPEQASKSVNKYLFDYSDKSKFDKVMGDFVDPFWTFHKNNAKLMYGSMFEHPGKINSIIRGTNGLENGVPEEQRQNENSKYGKIQKPYANFTDDVNNDQYNYLYKQNMFPDVEDAIPFEGDALENKMNPILRMLLQQSRGEGNFGNEIVEGDEAGWNEITKKQRAKEVLMDLNPFMPNAVKTMGSILERQQKADDGKQSQETSDKQILMDFINYITGNKGNWYRNIDF